VSFLFKTAPCSLPYDSNIRFDRQRVETLRGRITAGAVAAGIIVIGYAFMANAGTPAMAQEGNAMGNYASINGLEMYYETQGSGEPLIMLHGGLGGIAEFGNLPSMLATNRQVITAEMQGHGHTADIDRPLSFEQMADDVAGLMDHLGLERADIYGFSLGGGVALQTAIRYPERVRKLGLVSTPYSRAGWYPEAATAMSSMNAEVAQMMMTTPIYAAYAEVAPRPDDWPVLVTKVSQLLGRDYDWSTDVAAIEAPVLYIVGDADSVRLDHAVELFKLLGGGQADGGVGGLPKSRLAVLPATTHIDMIFRIEQLAALIAPFLDAPVP